jgi:hypothetical protein
VRFGLQRNKRRLPTERVALSGCLRKLVSSLKINIIKIKFKSNKLIKDLIQIKPLINLLVCCSDDDVIKIIIIFNTIK